MPHNTRLIRDCKIVAAVLPTNSISATTQYNGETQDSADGIDTRDWDEAVVIVSAGTAAGDGTVKVTLQDSLTDSVAAAEDITSAAFATITTSVDDAKQVGSVQMRANSRYLFVKAVKAGTGAVPYSVDVILYKGDKVPYDNSPVFDV